MKEIRRQIKEQDFQRVYLLTGDENYLILQAKELLVHAMVAEGDEMNYAVFEDSKIDLQQLRELAMTYPLFATKRVLVLDRTGIFKSGKDAFVEILQALPETTCVIICEPEVDKRSKAYKWIKKNGYVGEFLKKDQTEKVLMRWVAALLGKEKKKIRESDVRLFLERGDWGALEPYLPEGGLEVLRAGVVPQGGRRHRSAPGPLLQGRGAVNDSARRVQLQEPPADVEAAGVPEFPVFKKGQVGGSPADVQVEQPAAALPGDLVGPRPPCGQDGLQIGAGGGHHKVPGEV